MAKKIPVSETSDIIKVYIRHSNGETKMITPSQEMEILQDCEVLQQGLTQMTEEALAAEDFLHSTGHPIFKSAKEVVWKNRNYIIGFSAARYSAYIHRGCLPSFLFASKGIDRRYDISKNWFMVASAAIEEVVVRNIIIFDNIINELCEIGEIVDGEILNTDLTMETKMRLYSLAGDELKQLKFYPVLY